MQTPENDILNRVLDALRFAAEKHQFQRRSGYDALPYINHLIKVTHIIRTIAGESDPDILIAAALHDVIEDTEVTEVYLAERFGSRVASIVAELTDDMQLSYDLRKQHQLEGVVHLSPAAQKIRIADKGANIQDIITYPLLWDNRRKKDYVEWAIKIVNRIRGISPALEKWFDEQVENAGKILG
ncbi:MAG: HD domain-containing protein [Bacteroidia bacterium]|nr:HD domain-containing protein [Bacteroidia bacterium]